LKPRKYRAYGVPSLVDSTLKDTLPFNQSSSLSFQTPLLRSLKVKSCSKNVIILSSHSKANSLEPALNVKTPPCSTLQSFGTIPPALKGKSVQENGSIEL